MGKLKAVGLGVKALEDAFKAEQAAETVYKAADRAKAGNKAAELIKSQPQVKASEALGQSMEKGIKKVSTTQSDRTRVGGGNIGGANFPAISEADPEYARKVWGVMDEGTAKRLTNLSDPETAWTTMLGSATQLKTNPVVFDKLKKQFLAAMKEGKLSKELEGKINHNLELTFGEGAQIRDPNIWKEADTFEKRAALADLMMGQGIPPKKGGVALGGEKSGKGVIFKPTDTIIQETEPSLLHPEHGGEAETFALGPRLFKLSGTAEQRPDLHPGFPTLLHGEDLGYNFAPVPTEVFLPDWHSGFKKKNPDRKAGYYDLALGLKGEGLPSQELRDEYIRHLIREGYADGGEVHMGKGGLLSKATKALEEAITKLPKGSDAAKSKIEQEFAEEAARKAALYKVEKPSGEIGNKALDEARRILSTDSDITKAHGGVVHMANGGAPRKYVPPSQLFPINKDYEPVARNRAGQIVQNPNDIITGAAEGLMNTLAGAARGRTIGTLGVVGDTMESINDLGTQLRGVHDANMPMPARFGTQKTPEPVRIPTSEDLDKMLPSAGDSQEAKIGQTFGEFIPVAPQELAPIGRAVVKGAKSLAPAAANVAENLASKSQFGMPLQMNVVPPAEGAAQAVGKAAEVKAPANDLGFYSTVEKAALNLQRKSGNGDAFLSDLMKNQGVSQAKLDETGLTAALKGRKGVTRDEVQQLAAEGKISLKERVVKEFDEDEQSVQNHREKIERLNDKVIFYGRSIDTLNADLKKSVDMYGADNVNASQIKDKIKLMEEAYQQTYDELNKLNRVDLQENSAKYGPKNNPSYNTEGGENYREILIKTPENVAEPIDTSAWKVVTDDENKYSGQRNISILDAKGNIVAKRSGYRGSDYDAINNAAKTEQKYQTSQMNFDRSHHSDPNILMHLRVADHVDADGKKGLLIDELQSDWHQQGRDKGYGKKLTDLPQMSADELYEKHFDDLTPAQKEYLEGFMQKWEAADYNGKQDELDKLTNQYQNWTNKQNIGSGVLDAPFKDDWYQIGLKRAIKEATDNGMDRVYLTTGKTQADRYDLSKQVSKIEYDEYGNLRAFDKNGAQIISEAVPKDKLSDYVGKDMAKKIVENADKRMAAKEEYRKLLKSDASNDVVDVAYKEYLSHPTEYSGLDLQVGGEGMKQYYDKTYLNWLKKYAKQHNAEVGMTTLKGSYKKRADLSGKEMHDMEAIPEFKKILDEEFAKMDPNNPSMNKPWDAALKRFGGAPVYYIDLNPALKNTAKKGQAFADGGAVQSPNGFDYESHVNKLMDAHNLSNFDYEGHVKKIMGMAEGGAAYNTSPDMSDGGLSIQAPAFKIGGRIPLITR